MIGLADLVEILDKNENPEDFYEYTNYKCFRIMYFVSHPKGLL